MTPSQAHWWLNLASAVGIGLLSVPVWSLNYRKKKLKQIRDELPESPERFRDRVRGILKDRWGRDVSDWRAIDEWFLLLGYACLLGGAVLRLFVPDQ